MRRTSRARARRRRRRLQWWCVAAAESAGTTSHTTIHHGSRASGRAHGVDRSPTMTTVFCSSSAADHYDAPTLTDLLVRLLVLVALACQPDAHAEGDVAHALRPQVLVKLGVEAHVLRLHRLLRKLAELADGARRALLEGDTVQPLVKIDGVLARDQVGRGLLLTITPFTILLQL